MPYKYMKLRGKIIEKYGSISAFVKVLGVSGVTVSKKLNGRRGFSQEDMDTWAKLLGIKLSEYGKYFFT